MWGASLNGTITEWDSRSHAVRRTISITSLLGRQCRVLNLLFVDGNLWCGLGNMIVVVDPATGRFKKRAVAPGSSAGIPRSSSVANFHSSGVAEVRPAGESLPRVVSSGAVGEAGDDIIIKTSAGHNLIHGFPGEVRISNTD